MKAVIEGTTIAEAKKEDVVKVDGALYFPPSGLRADVFVKSPTAYSCSWRGPAQYFTVQVDGREFVDAAWSYSELSPGAVEKVGRDTTGYVAFSPVVTLVDEG